MSSNKVKNKIKRSSFFADFWLILLLGVLLGILIGAATGSLSYEPILGLFHTRIPQRSEPQTSEPQTSVLAPHLSAPSSEPLPKNWNLKSKTPTLEQYQKSALADPHAVPLVIKEFSAVLTEIMTPAMSSETRALNTLKDLGDCAVTSEIQTIRMQCLANLSRLEKRWPDLGPQIRAEKNRTSPADRQKLKDLGL